MESKVQADSEKLKKFMSTEINNKNSHNSFSELHGTNKI